MMFRFSCFHPHIQNKSKKTVEPSDEAMVKKASGDGAQNQVTQDSSISSNSEFQVSSGPTNDGSTSLVGYPMPSDEDAQKIIDTPLSGKLACDYPDQAASPGAPSLMEDHKVTTGMEAAKRYISSISGNATKAHLPNHGLLVIPFFNTFESLEVLNLSGNAIVRITAGTLPTRLHSLNLSKNNISIIEGLRKLTRLRVLNLSYNRIRRIGHGLASCYSLKELYLVGNKISEVEGLHRLLKLSILDIRFNEISSAKCLGQLAANYTSLQAINLDGNPINSVGDEQLKKYVQVILPHLVYYNGHPIKVSTLKDDADQSFQLGMNSLQFDRVLRLDNKTMRKGNLGVLALQRSSTTSSRAHRNQTLKSSKLPKGKHDNKDLMPPTEAQASIRNRYSRRFFWFPILT